MADGSGGDGEVVKHVARVARLAAAGAPHHDDGLVEASRQHVAIGDLRRRVHVRRHVLRTAATEHLNHLKWNKTHNFRFRCQIARAHKR